MGELLRPTSISEPIIYLPDRTVKVVGTKHGDWIDFPGQEQTEKELEDFFGEDRFQGLLLDSLPLLEHEGEFIRNSLLGIPQEKSGFIKWAVLYAAKHESCLIGADPANSNPAFRIILESEEVYAFISNNFFSNRPREIDIAEVVGSFGGVATGILLGSAMNFGLMRAIMKRNPTRREFLFQSLIVTSFSIASAIRSGQFGYVLNLLNKDPQEEETYFIDPFGRRMVASKESEGTVRLRALTYAQNSRQATELSNQYRTLIESDYEEEFFLQLSARHLKDYSYHLAFRNAIIAEGLAQPLDKLFPHLELEKAELAAVMGWGHLILPPELRISWLLSHDDERKRIIRELTQALFSGVNRRLLGGTNVDKLREGFLNMGRVYKIDPQNFEIETYKFPIPALEEAVDSVQDL